MHHIYELEVKFLTSSFDSPTPISLLSAKFPRFGDVFIDFCILCWMSAILLCLTYWPRKYTTRVNPHFDNFHQVWSWYDHPLPSYSVLYADMLRDLDLWPTVQLLYRAGHMSNPATKFEDVGPFRSWVMSHNVFHWIPLALLFWFLRMHHITWPVHRGKFYPHVWNPQPDLSIHYATSVALR